jgi:hypothetical protein
MLVSKRILINWFKVVLHSRAARERSQGQKNGYAEHRSRSMIYRASCETVRFLMWLAGEFQNVKVWWCRCDLNLGRERMVRFEEEADGGC